MNELLMLKELQQISSTNEKKDYISTHMDNKLFIKLLKFLVDDKIVTNISRKKFNKITEIKDDIIYDLSDFIDYLSTKSTGKDSDVIAIKSHISPCPEKLQPILAEIACKDIPLGVGVKLYNKVVNKEDVILDFPYMGAVVFNQKKVDKLFDSNIYLYSQTKLDGCFVASYVSKDKIIFYARSGLQMLIKGKLVQELKQIQNSMDNFILNGELLIQGIENRSVANGIIRGLLSSNVKIENGDEKEYNKFTKKYGMTIDEVQDRLQMVCWDIIDTDALQTGKCDKLYFDRFETLGGILTTPSIKIVESRMVKEESEVKNHFSEILSNGGEGVILKSPFEPFKTGKPVYQIKYKQVCECELKITGFESGKPNTKYENTLGAFMCESSCGQLKTNVSGISETVRDEVWNNKDEFVGKIITVKFNGISSNSDGGNGLLYSVFVEFREDKSVSDSWNNIVKIAR